MYLDEEAAYHLTGSNSRWKYPLFTLLSVLLACLTTALFLLDGGLFTSSLGSESLFHNGPVLFRPPRPNSDVHQIQKTKENKDLVIYVYYESNRGRLNLEFFLKHALHGKADFLFVVNGETDVEFPTHLPNVELLYRHNTCYDLGTHHAVYTNKTKYNSNRLKKYERFLFTNASLRGPFFPSWARDICWTDAYWDKLSDRIKLVGMSYWCEPGVTEPVYNQRVGSHLQSPILATDKIGADIIMAGLKCFTGHEDAVMEGEIQLSKNIRNAGYEAYAMMGAFEARGGLEGASSAFQEQCQPGKTRPFESLTFSPYETLFAKTNEGSYPEFPEFVVNQLSEWAAATNYSSFDACR